MGWRCGDEGGAGIADELGAPCTCEWQAAAQLPRQPLGAIRDKMAADGAPDVDPRRQRGRLDGARPHEQCAQGAAKCLVRGAEREGEREGPRAAGVQDRLVDQDDCAAEADPGGGVAADGGLCGSEGWR